MNAKELTAKLAEQRAIAEAAMAALLKESGVTAEELALAVKADKEAAKKEAATKKAEKAAQEAAWAAAKEEGRVAHFRVGDTVRCGFMFGTLTQLKKDGYWEVKADTGTRWFVATSGSRVWQLVDPSKVEAIKAEAKIAHDYQAQVWAERSAEAAPIATETEATEVAA